MKKLKLLRINNYSKEVISKYNLVFKQLYKDYDKLLKTSFNNGLWNSKGNYYYHRINNKDFFTAKKDLMEIFEMQGLYIWGVDKTPLYIGKSEKQKFKKRFNRYVSKNGKKAQCHLAGIYSKKYEKDNKEIDIKKLMSKENISKPRAIGVKCFAENGADKIWFILIPLKKEVIADIELALIAIGDLWNIKKGYKPLINLSK